MLPTRDHRRDATSNALEKALGCSLIDAFAADIEFGTVLIDGSPQLIKLAARRHKHLAVSKVKRNSGLMNGS